MEQQAIVAAIDLLHYCSPPMPNLNMGGTYPQLPEISQYTISLSNTNLCLKYTIYALYVVFVDFQQVFCRLKQEVFKYDANVKGILAELRRLIHMLL